MKVICCGGRDFYASDFIAETLEWFCFNVEPISLLIHGAAPGADTICGQWAEKFDVPVKDYPANWKRFGNAAGPIRNKLMLDKHPDVRMVIAFPGHVGTADMVKQARARGVTVRQVKPRPDYHQTVSQWVASRRRRSR